MPRPKRRRSDRALRARTHSPGRPPVASREDRQRFWAAIAKGLTTEDAGRTMLRLKDEFFAQDVQYRLLEYDARAKKDGLVKIVMSIEAPATMTTEHLALLVVRDGVQSVSLEEEDVS